MAFSVVQIQDLVLPEHFSNTFVLLFEKFVHCVEFIFNIAEFEKGVEVFVVIDVFGEAFDVEISLVFECMFIAEFFEVFCLVFRLTTRSTNIIGIFGMDGELLTRTLIYSLMDN